MNPETLFDAIRTLLQAKSESEARMVLKYHPELLGNEGDIMLQQLIYKAKQHGDARQEKSLGRDVNSWTP